MRVIAAAAAALFLSAAASASDAPKGDAVLAKVSGPVFLVPAGGKALRAAGGEVLLYGDAVRTGKGGVAHLVIGDRGAVLVNEGSVFALTGNPRATLLDFARGEFLIGLKKALSRGESFRVRTPAAVAAVRGTLFWGKSDAAKTTTYAGFGHEIAVTAQKKTVVVKAGQQVEIGLGQAPGELKPHEVPVSYLTSTFALDDDLQGLEELVNLPKP